MTKINNLKHRAQIPNAAGPFEGTYEWKGGASYYLDGRSDTGDIHFTVVGEGYEEFALFHVSHPLTGAVNGSLRFRKNKVGWDIWEDAADIDSRTNINEIRSELRPVFRTWLTTSDGHHTNLEYCAQAARAFVVAVE